MAKWKGKKQFLRELSGWLPTYEIKFFAHISTRFITNITSYFTLNIFPPERRVGDFIHTGNDKLCINLYNGRVCVGGGNEINSICDGTDEIAIFVRSANHLKVSLRKLGKYFGLRR